MARARSGSSTNDGMAVRSQYSVIHVSVRRRIKDKVVSRPGGGGAKLKRLETRDSRGMEWDAQADMHKVPRHLEAD
ncbi:hypothetical protein E4U55_007791 [Claviceps digitariae]|nr:hypothetical protein E4U55_007791 [Claviceps digitariae]